MSLLENKKIVLGITGGIAAYKCADLTRRLREQGAIVKVVMTKGAQAFITPLTMQAVSGNPVMDDLLDPAAEAAMGHIELAKWADTILIAPATANFMASLSQGLAGDLLSTICLATSAPIAICPAMNQQMWAAPATQRNLATLLADGHAIFGPGTGEQACGDIGAGRMLEPLEIISQLQRVFTQPLLNGKKITITAGPTQEAIDPVRYLSNHSSGKMGFAIAKAAINLGAKVTLIAGPVSLATPVNCQRIDVKSAEQMLAATQQACLDSDIFIACAAVADYAPETVAENKIKKSNETMAIALKRNPDILATIAGQQDKPFCVGFAAETQDVEHYAKDKLSRKNLDMIAANNVAISGQGFASDNNALSVFWKNGQQDLTLADKETLAYQLLELIEQNYSPK
ncbi:bifunctional phosphopantothenoylcysteine decarboxylase/phosphopantothenate--cysteine ligase CoaBC [Catenovulum sp. SM1970]|uniref:bifunctional phosphopantothenoylcysteine decarboxylase/phosphopantothenate--cysteine ligase CoaBC n=1 Tax=Marinifaba aquimaris TaxID=2741323 RepID=UPI0015716AF0|nr:bifunctional phosphopantothenoylcysteine decarboxylase/phosphopantothenate--cysteine ligase CoaBC [Marinifaba aquimaris]